ncbi:Bug family tripartite tricarboxylate transporter substrate binding protein [Sediminicoccus sp. BL-A-41-H5]|uniref:Bug family tripartite tricarboxylate transporter substrate binding protein n=1 Tax=Sediminicoccus sp. BL-A-41-H5 TaxID=3421106 RepID=UPI003D678993
MRRRVLLAAGGLAIPGIARATWPQERPIEVIIPFPPGGGVDQMGRLVAHHLPRHLPGARMAVINRPGAGGQIGFEALFNAAPDGFTIGAATNTAMHAIAIERRPRYRPDEFTLIANVVDDPGAFWVTARSPWRTLDDLRMAARGRPGEIGVGTAGIGSDDHMLLLAFEAAAGVNLLHVPYAGTAPIQRDLLVGTLAIGAFNGSEALTLLRDGRIRGLAQGGPERWAPLGPVPTFREAGFDVLGGSSRGIAAPPGLHPEITLQFELAFSAMLADADFLRDAAQQGFPMRPLVGRAYRQMMAADYANLRALWQRRPWRE